MTDTTERTETSERPQFPYDRLGGEAGIRALAHAFYANMKTLPQAATIRAMHKDDLSAIEEKLFEYLSTWLGGPDIYMRKYGGMCLTKGHKPYKIDAAARDAWLACMDKALDDVGVDPEYKAMLTPHFFRIADFIRNSE